MRGDRQAEGQAFPTRSCHRGQMWTAWRSGQGTGNPNTRTTAQS